MTLLDDFERLQEQSIKKGYMDLFIPVLVAYALSFAVPKKEVQHACLEAAHNTAKRELKEKFSLSDDDVNVCDRILEAFKAAIDAMPEQPRVDADEIRHKVQEEIAFQQRPGGQLH